MEIRFCEITKESIPDGEFEAGRAITVGGKSYYVSAALQRIMSRGRVRGWLTFLLVLYAAGATTFLLLAELRREKPNPDYVSPRVVAEMQRRDEALETHVAGLFSTRFESLAKEVREALGSAEGQRKELFDGLARLSHRIDAQTKKVQERLEGMDRRQTRVEEEVNDVRGWLLKVQGTADELLKRQTAIEAARAAAPPKPAAAAAGPAPEVPAASKPDPEHEAELTMWIERLKSKNADLVFTATVKLADLKDLRATDPLRVVLVKHKDLYARLGAATALGTLRAVSAVPDLIETLGDKEDLVRTAAIEALIAITGQDYGFEADMSRSERNRVKSKYRTWFKQNEAELRRKLDQAVEKQPAPPKR